MAQLRQDNFSADLALLPRFLQVFEYVNVDAIASGLSPLNPENGLRKNTG
jgi:predicted ABC-type ATPase